MLSKSFRVISQGSSDVFNVSGLLLVYCTRVIKLPEVLPLCVTSRTFANFFAKNLAEDAGIIDWRRIEDIQDFDAKTKTFNAALLTLFKNVVINKMHNLYITCTIKQKSKSNKRIKR